MLQIALPNKGGLSDEAVRLVKEAGYNCTRSGRELVVADTVNNVEFFFLRPRDIAIYVSSGVLDMGITGRDLAADSKVPIKELLSLGFGKSGFYYAVPQASDLTPEDLNGLRIATSYSGLVASDLKKRGFDSSVVRLDGAVEISIRMGVADVIADVVQTGKTLTAAGLKIVGEPMIESQAVLMTRENKSFEGIEGGEKFLERLQGIVVAREYIIVEYDIAEIMLEKACAITPGIESPTISPLSKAGWVAVKSMAPKKDINCIMDDLIAIGAKGIIVTDIRTCRI